MVPEVIKIEEDGVLNHKNPVSLGILGCEVIKKTKKSSLVSYPFSFGTVPFRSARLHWNRTERFDIEAFLQRTQKSTDGGSKWNGSKGFSVSARLIRTNFGTVPFGSSVSGVLRKLTALFAFKISVSK